MGMTGTITAKPICWQEALWDQIRLAPSDRCWEWQGNKDRQGYGMTGLTRRKGQGPRRAHRLAYVSAYGECPPHLCVLHKCDNPSCCRPDHLELGTRTQNATDRDSKGRHALKLTADQVVDIRRRYFSGGISQQALADEHGVNQGAISYVIRNIRINDLAMARNTT